MREEMDRAGALELCMPTVQPAELWKESGRWSKYGPELLRFKDRHEREFAYGPTHEEVITDIARRELRSYKQLPVNFYQIQSKFRDEIRPRFGVMRAREFLMKDAYSFHVDEPSLAQGYRAMFDAYTRIFTRMGLKFRAVQADGGSIGGSVSQEFHVLADSGEDAIAFSDGDDYAANVETAASRGALGAARRRRRSPWSRYTTPNVRTIASLSAFLRVDACTMRENSPGGGQRRRRGRIDPARRPRAQCGQSAKDAGGRQSLAHGERGAGSPSHRLRTRLDRSDRLCRQGLRRSCRGAAIGFRLRRQREGRCTSPVSIGAAICPSRAPQTCARCRPGDPSPTGRGTLQIARGIEVGHIFQLGQLYSRGDARDGARRAGQRARHVHGLLRHRGHTRGRRGDRAKSRCQRHYLARAPGAFSRRIGADQLSEVASAYSRRPTALYEEFRAAGIDVLLDDRDARPGVKFADSELIGIPHRLVIGDRGLSTGKLEYRHRRETESTEIPVADAVAYIRHKLNP